MLTLPTGYSTLLSPFRSHFSKRIWKLALALLIGAILAPHKRTVTACLRIVGLHRERRFLKYHRVLSRAVWSSLAPSQTLLVLLVTTFAATGTLVFGVDDTIERRWGLKIRARGIYRDPVRSSHSHFVKASGLRWLCTMLLVPIPWAQRVWALPFLTVLAPSERYYEHSVRAAKKLTDWVWQALLQVRRWLPKRRIVVVADSSFAVISLLARVQRLKDPITMVVRFRMDAALYEQASPRQPKQKGAPRKKGKRLPTLEQRLKNKKTKWQRVTIPNWYGEGTRVIELCSDIALWYHSGQPTVLLRWVLIRDPKGKFKSQALLCTDPNVNPEQIVQWFTLRWQLEVTLAEVRAHLGVETQRQWSDKAIMRTTPALLGLFSLITLLAHHSTQRGRLPVRQTAWYTKTAPTFSDALAIVRQTLWQHLLFSMCKHTRNVQKISEHQIQRLTSALSYTNG
ncbi:transposase [Anaerolineae bacterium CFX7]|nr:transposase [Anaerolineae bacterium CFX7]